MITWGFSWLFDTPRCDGPKVLLFLSNCFCGTTTSNQLGEIPKRSTNFPPVHFWHLVAVAWSAMAEILKAWILEKPGFRTGSDQYVPGDQFRAITCFRQRFNWDRHWSCCCLSKNYYWRQDPRFTAADSINSEEWITGDTDGLFTEKAITWIAKNTPTQQVGRTAACLFTVKPRVLKEPLSDFQARHSKEFYAWADWHWFRAPSSEDPIVGGAWAN